MNWLITISNITFASFAILLCVLSWNTLKRIRHLHVGKSFWIPTFVAGLLFAVGSVISILNELVLSLTIAIEIGQITELVAFCSLSIGVYSYSRMISKNLPAEYAVPEVASSRNNVDDYMASLRSSGKAAKVSNNGGADNGSGCNHQVGYLRTLADDVSLPEECLSCEKIMECKKA